MTRIEALRKIVNDGQYAKVPDTDGKKVSVDSFTASMLVQIHDKLNPTNQEMFVNLPLMSMVNLGWRLCK